MQFVSKNSIVTYKLLVTGITPVAVSLAQLSVLLLVINH